MKTYIPKISDGLLEHLAESIKPVISQDNKKYFIQKCDLKKVAYTWDPVITVEAGNLSLVSEITTYHRFGYYGFFKPSVAEVIAQIPENLRSKVTAFEIVESPSTSDDLQKYSKELNDGYHVAKTRLYCQ